MEKEEKEIAHGDTGCCPHYHGKSYYLISVCPHFFLLHPLVHPTVFAFLRASHDSRSFELLLLPLFHTHCLSSHPSTLAVSSPLQFPLKGTIQLYPKNDVYVQHLVPASDAERRPVWCTISCHPTSSSNFTTSVPRRQGAPRSRALPRLCR